MVAKVGYIGPLANSTSNGLFMEQMPDYFRLFPRGDWLDWFAEAGVGTADFP